MDDAYQELCAIKPKNGFYEFKHIALTLIAKVKEKTMAKKTIFWVMLVMVLAFGVMVVGCDNGSIGGGGADNALNGTWVDEDGFELKLNNGNFDSGFMKGTYTTSGSNITITTTHVHGDMMNMNMDMDDKPFASQWYTKTEMKTAIKTVFGEYSGEYIHIITDAEIDEIINEMFVAQTGTYSVSGNTLTMTMGGEPTTFTKK
jgi:hypothetical protein